MLWLQLDLFSTEARRFPASSLNSREQVRKLPAARFLSTLVFI
jgi:hypothetical protein